MTSVLWSGGPALAQQACQPFGDQTCTNSVSLTGGITGIGANTLTVTNTKTGIIQGNDGLGSASGIFAGVAVTVTNDGVISGTSAGASNTGTGIFGPTATVTNNAGGTILGIGQNGANGTGITSLSGSVANHGTISGIGSGVSSMGIGIGGRGTVINYADGIISGIAGPGNGIGINISGTVTNYGTITGNRLAINFSVSRDGNMLTVGPTSIINGTVVAGGSNNTLQLGGSGVGSFDVGLIGPAAQYQGFNTFNKIDDSTWTLTGATAGALPWNVQQGTLLVNGSLPNATFTVNGGVLGGTGTIGNTQINSGGTFAPGSGAPGTSITVRGNLAFQSGAIYLVQLNSTSPSSANVTGTASLGGAVQAVFAPGIGNPAKSYDILHAGGFSGTFAPTVQTTNLPPGFTTKLSYTATDVLLNVTATLGGPQQATGLSSNHLSVAGAINNFFNDPPLPPAFLPLFSLTGGNLANALTMLSGEAATGAQQPAFQLTNQFLNIMLDPFVDGRSNVNGGGAIGFAPEREELADDVALAYAKILKAPPKPQTFDQPWSVWGAGYGGSNRTTGDLAAGGSHDLSASTAGGTAGLDYRLAPGTVVGFALAGGGTNWGLAQGLGGGKSDAFQAGVYGTARWGSAYLAAALAFTNNWMSTDRFAFAGDHLSASFNAQSYGGRVESGYRFMTYYGGLTPYAAIQSQTFHTPGYIETDLNAGGFALGFNSRNATDTRSELGGRFDHLLLLNPEAALTMRTRVAWAHDWVSDPTLTAGFQMLPGTSFIVNGATPAKNSALVSEGAELRLANGVVLLAKFDGEFASHSTTYAGTGTVRYTW
jgi:uncharacterized protein with beta-barrel porin domain